MFNRNPHLADPSFIPSHATDGTLQVVIETPRGSRNKYAFDHERNVVALKKILPAGMVFPYDFGFVPSTLAPDGDPIDVLLLMDEPAFPGCVLDARLIGVIEGEDLLEEDGQPTGERKRNDRLVAIASLSHAFENVQSIDDLPRQLLDHMQQFFANYPRLLSGKTYELLGVEGPEEAAKLVKEACARA